MSLRRLAYFFRSWSLSPPTSGLTPETPPPAGTPGRSIGLFPYIWTRTV